MTITFLSLFFYYPLVFLAVIFLAWIITVWRYRHRKMPERFFVSCSCCGSKLNRGHSLISIRCSKCGARHELQEQNL